MAEAYSPIRVSTLRGDLEIPFDAYVKVADKYILYCRRGDSFEGDRLARLKSKKLKTMYIVTDQKHAYQSYMNDNLNRAYDSAAGRSMDIRAQVIQGATEAMIEDLFDEFDSEARYNSALHAAKKFSQFLLVEKDSTKALLDIKNDDDSAAHHGINVATIATSIATKLGLFKHREKLLAPFSLGCMLHDIEHQNSGFQFEQDVTALKGQALADYIQHPRVGANKIKDLGHYDMLVINIILQHEECADGSGFPQGLNQKQIDPLVIAVSVANSFDRMISFQKIPVKDALKNMLIEKMGLYPLEYLQALQQCLKTLKVIG